MTIERIRSLETITLQATGQAEAERTRRILEFCRTPRSREEIQTLLGLKDREYFRKDILEPLRASGRLELTESDKPTSPKQRSQTKEPVS